MNELSTKRFWEVRHQIFNGDLLLFRNGGLIPVAGRSVYSHAAMAGWWVGGGVDHLMCLELRELRGGRAVTLISQVMRFPGRIDVYRPNLTADQREKAFAAMRGKAGHDYNYWGLISTACLHLPGIRFFAKPDLSDLDILRGRHPEYCSQAVASAYRLGAGVDPVPNLNDRLTEPADLARSSLFSYLMTLVP